MLLQLLKNCSRSHFLGAGVDQETGNRPIFCQYGILRYFFFHVHVCMHCR